MGVASRFVVRRRSALPFAALRAAVPTGGRRSRPYASPPLWTSSPRREPLFPGGVATCAVRSTARADRRSAFQAVCAVRPGNGCGFDRLPAVDAGPRPALRRHCV